MSRFYGSIKSDTGKSESTRRGNQNLSAHIRGWRDGVRIELNHCKETNTDRIKVYRTGGSNKVESDELITSWPFRK